MFPRFLSLFVKKERPYSLMNLLLCQVLMFDFLITCFSTHDFHPSRSRFFVFIRYFSCGLDDRGRLVFSNVASGFLNGRPCFWPTYVLSVFISNFSGWLLAVPLCVIEFRKGFCAKRSSLVSMASLTHGCFG